VEHFDPDIDWVFPPNFRADSCHGAEEIKRFWRDLDATFEEFWLEPLEFIDAGEFVLVRLRFHGRGKTSGAKIDEEMFHQATSFRDGRMVRDAEIDIRYAIVFTTRDGKIATGREYFTREEALEAPGCRSRAAGVWERPPRHVLETLVPAHCPTDGRAPKRDTIGDLGARWMRGPTERGVRMRKLAVARVGADRRGARARGVWRRRRRRYDGSRDNADHAGRRWRRGRRDAQGDRGSER
jgi:SnoaL-like domain